MRYFINTNSMILLRRTYSPEFFEPLWIELHSAISKKVISSTRINFEELRVEEDDIFNEWKDSHREMFLDIIPEVQEYVVAILSRFPDLIDPDSDKEQADPYLIGYAMHYNSIVVTEEARLSTQALSDPKRKKKVRIPNVCDHFNIRCMNVVEFVNSGAWRV